MKNTIVTHSGSFHPDEILAIALMLINCKDGEKMSIIRTRNITPEFLKENDVGIVVDVGGEHGYINDTLYFDHLHFEKDHKLYGLSSAGLVIKEIEESKRTLFSDEIKDMVKAVDQQDTRVDHDPMNKFEALFNLVSGCNMPDNHCEEQDKIFLELVKVFKQYILEIIVSPESNKQQSFSKLCIDVGRFYNAILPLHEALKSERLGTIKRMDILKVGDAIAYRAAKGEIHVPISMLPENLDIYIYWDKEQVCWTVQCADTNKFKLTRLGTDDEVFVHANGFKGKYTEHTENINDTYINFVLNKEHQSIPTYSI